jgi:hypothetical protein
MSLAEIRIDDNAGILFLTKIGIGFMGKQIGVG